jgi:AcrR family transcriptional regulator
VTAIESQRGRLSRQSIAQSAADIIGSDGLAAFSLRSVAKSLGVDPAAIYRHYENVDDLLRDVADLALAPVTEKFVTSADPRDDVRRLLLRLRNVLLSSGVARLNVSGPSRHSNELRITEVMLTSFAKLGLSSKDAVMAYHVLIEFTVGSASLDAPLASSPADRRDTYKRWRTDYRTVDAETYPAIAAHASLLYPSSEKVFATGLEALLNQLLVGSHSGD